MKLLDGFKDPKPEVAAPEVSAPVPAVGGSPATTTLQDVPAASAPVASPNASPSTNPASGNIEGGAKPYEPPNLLNSLQQLFN